MPSAKPLPTIPELLQAFSDAVKGSRTNRADTRRGAGYDLAAGVGAVLLSREAQRDRDLFRATYFDSADGDDLTNLGVARYGSAYARILDTYGVGTATLARPTAVAGETIHVGTRIIVIAASGITEPVTYVATTETPVAAGQTSVTIPIRASVYGTGVATNTQAGAGTIIRIDDALVDTGWSVTQITCADGTKFEAPQDYRARVRQTRALLRKGYQPAMVNALATIGVVNYAFFASNYVGDAYDCGLNYLYIGDANYSASSSLITQAVLLLESYRVAGADLQILPMAPAPMSVVATVNLWDDPGTFNIPSLQADIVSSLVGYIGGRSNAFTYRLDAMVSAAQANAAVQTITFTTPSSDATVTTGLPAQFPAVLQRYTLSPAGVTLSFAGPT